MHRTRLFASLWQGAAARRHALPLAASLALAALTGCAESGTDEEPFDPNGAYDAGVSGNPQPTYDASTGPSVTQDAGIPWTPIDAGPSGTDAGSSAPKDAGASKPDATVSGDGGNRDAAVPGGGGLNIDDLITGLFGDGGAPADGGFTPPPDGGGEWSLNPGSFVDCPPEPPPIPIIGGLCAGIYYGCGWTNQSGQQYSCICDWVHWLCI
jgi:hypothetical protein